ncbi:MAG: peptidase M48, partial [Paracoccaceae bacterium]|nr:peptidase M48 [Paracoccaceae bacterium]
MLKFTPILLAILYAVAMYRFSAWRTAKELDARSTELADPVLRGVMDRLAAALDLPR